MIANRHHSSWLKDLLLLTILFSIFMFPMLGDRPFNIPDEARYAEIPREMVESGDYLTPRLNYLKYFEKPPLFYWMQSVSIQWFGLSEWSLRFMNALMALFGALITYAAARRLYGRSAGWLASMVLASSLYYAIFARMITLDMTVGIFITACLLSFLVASQESEQKKRRWLYLAAYLFAALATLTKGLIGIVFPAMVIGLWIILLNNWRLLLNCYLIRGILLFLLIVLPWHILMQLKNPEFFDFYIVLQHFQRFAETGTYHLEPWWFYIPYLLLGFFPWIVFIPQIVRFNWISGWKNRQHEADKWFFWIWFIAIFLFFSASKSKLIPYIVPLFPPLAIMAGRYFANIYKQHVLPNSFSKSLVLLMIISLLVGIALIALPFITPLLNADHFIIYASIMALLLILGSSSAYLLIKQRFINAAIITIILTASLNAMALNLAAKYIDSRPVKDLAMTLKPLLDENSLVAGYNYYYQDLPFYLQRKIIVINYLGELDFGYELEVHPSWMIKEENFWPIWNNQQDVFMIVNNNDYETLLQRFPDYHFHVIAQNNRNVLLTNKEL